MVAVYIAYGCMGLIIILFVLTLILFAKGVYPPFELAIDSTIQQAVSANNDTANSIGGIENDCK